MSETYTGYAKDVMSGDFMQSSNVVEGVRSNLSFRVRSAREMLMGLNDASAVNPIERRMQIRNNRLELLGMRSSQSESGTSQPNDGGLSSRVSTPQTSPSSSSTVDSNNKLMSEVDRGTKARAQDRGFGN